MQEISDNSVQDGGMGRDFLDIIMSQGRGWVGVSSPLCLKGGGGTGSLCRHHVSRGRGWVGRDLTAITIS